MSKNDNKTILIVEDEVLIAMAEQMELEKCGYTVLTVNTGEEAVVLSKDNNDIDLILMDIDLGKGLDGTEAAAIILKEKNIPVVFLSSHTDLKTVEKTEKITSYGYVVKSSSTTVLDASIKMALKLFNAYKEINKRNMLIEAGNENLRVTIEDLETSRNRLDSIFRAAPTGIGVVKDRVLVEINYLICEMTGYQEKELIGSSARILYPTQEDFDFVGREKYAQIKLNDTGTVETQWKCKDGKIIDVLLSSTPMDVKNVDKGVTFTALDITESKKIRCQLQESENRYKAIFNKARYGLQLTDREGRILQSNPAHHKIHGYENEELVGKYIWDLMLDETQRQQAKAFYNKIMEEQPVPEAYISRDLTRDKREIYTQIVWDYVRDSEGQVIGILSIIDDITARKKSEAILIENEAKFRNLIKTASDAIYLISEEGEIIETNDSACAMLNRTENEIKQLHVSEIDINFPGNDFISFWEEIPMNVPQVFETIHQKKDGTRFPVEVNGQKFSIEDETFYFGIARDIKERKQAEDKLLESSKLNQQIIDCAHEGIIVYGTDLRYKVWNPFMELLSGIKADEVLGKHPLEVFPFLEGAGVMNRLEVALKGETPDSAEFPFNIEGRSGWTIDSSVPLISAKGDVEGVIATVQDISKYKIAEEKTQALLREKEIILKETHHRIKNNFESIVSLLSLQRNSLTNPEAVTALNDAAGRVNSMKVLYEKMLLSDNYKTASIKNFLDKLIDDLAQNFPIEIDIKVEKQIDDFQTDSKKLAPVGIIINELLTNAIKYAFTNIDSGLIEIVLKENEGDVILTVKDDGNGLPDGFDIAESKGLGLILVKMLVKQLDGSFYMENRHGLKTLIKFKV